MGQVSVLNRCSGELAPFLPYFLPPSPAPSSVSRYLESPEALPFRVTRTACREVTGLDLSI